MINFLQEGIRYIPWISRSFRPFSFILPKRVQFRVGSLGPIVALYISIRRNPPQSQANVLFLTNFVRVPTRPVHPSRSLRIFHRPSLTDRMASLISILLNPDSVVESIISSALGGTYIVLSSSLFILKLVDNSQASYDFCYFIDPFINPKSGWLISKAANDEVTSKKVVHRLKLMFKWKIEYLDVRRIDPKAYKPINFCIFVILYLLF